MKILIETKKLVLKEKELTAKILSNLYIIERDKLYSDLKYSSLYNYLIKELGYSDSEAGIRSKAVRLMFKSTKAKNQIEKGKINLTNAAEAGRVLMNEKEPAVIDKIVEKAGDCSSRDFKRFTDIHFNRDRTEIVYVHTKMVEKFDKLRKIYGDKSTIELIGILLEKELNKPGVILRKRAVNEKNSRFIPKMVKAQAYTGVCANCGARQNLEYDHKVKYSHGGTNAVSNIQMLCRNCNKRKEIKARQMNVFV